MKLLKSLKLKAEKGFVHSIGISQLSLLLSEVKIFEEIKVIFNNAQGSRMGVYIPGSVVNLKHLKGDSRDLLSYKTLISANYSTPLDSWTVYIYPVKLDLNKATKEFLVNKLILILKDWLAMEKSESWYIGHRYFQIGINEDLTEYCVFETQNDRIISKLIEKLS